MHNSDAVTADSSGVNLDNPLLKTDREGLTAT